MRYTEADGHQIISKTHTGNAIWVAPVTFVAVVDLTHRTWAVYAGGVQALVPERTCVEYVRKWGAKLPETWAYAIFENEVHPEARGLEYRN